MKCLVQTQFYLMCELALNTLKQQREHIFLLQGFGFFHEFQFKETQTTGIPNLYQVYQVDI